MQIGPQSVHFKVGFIHFDCRTLSLGTILSDRFDHILIGEKIEFFTQKHGTHVGGRVNPCILYIGKIKILSGVQLS